jgi:hypothetical protein
MIIYLNVDVSICMMRNMAQHHLIYPGKSNEGNFVKVTSLVLKDFKQGIEKMKNRNNYKLIPYDDYKENQNDIVFVKAVKAISGQYDLEIHYDSLSKKITKIYQVI